LLKDGFLHRLESVKDEFQNKGYDLLIVTGLNSSKNYYAVSMNGYLIFYHNIISTAAQSKDFHSIEVYAFSELGWEGRAHFTGT
jgi:hypothetical protein